MSRPGIATSRTSFALAPVTGFLLKLRPSSRRWEAVAVTDVAYWWRGCSSRSARGSLNTGAPDLADCRENFAARETHVTATRRLVNGDGMVRNRWVLGDAVILFR